MIWDAEPLDVSVLGDGVGDSLLCRSIGWWQPFSGLVTRSCFATVRREGSGIRASGNFPGGHIDSEEQPEQALRRELLEEVGVDIGIVRQEPVLHLTDRDAGFDLTVWLVTNWAGTVENRQSEEHDLIGWFEVKDLPALDFADSSYLPLLQRLLLGA